MSLESTGRQVDRPVEGPRGHRDCLLELGRRRRRVDPVGGCVVEVGRLERPGRGRTEDRPHVHRPLVEDLDFPAIDERAAPMLPTFPYQPVPGLPSFSG